MLIKAIYSNCEIPLSRIITVNINESIHSPIIEGSFIFKMNENKKDVFDYSNKTLFLICYDPIRDLQFMLRYTVYSETNTTNSLTGEKEISLNFLSIYGIDFINQNRSIELLNMKYSDMIKKLLTELNININVWTDTMGKYDEVLPFVDRLNSIRHIQRKCVDNNNNGGFLLFPNLLNDKMNFVTYKSLRNNIFGKYDKMLVNFDVNGYDYIGKINDFHIDEDTNMIDDVEKGLNSIKSSGIDFNTGPIRNFSYDIQKSIGGDETIKGKLLLDKKYVGDEYEISKSTFHSKKEISSRLNNEFQHRINNSIKANCTAVGDFTRKLGSYIEVLVQTENNRSVDSMLSDRYIISEISHSFKIGVYEQQLTLIKPVYRKAVGENLVQFG